MTGDTTHFKFGRYFVFFEKNKASNVILRFHEKLVPAQLYWHSPRLRSISEITYQHHRSHSQLADPWAISSSRSKNINDIKKRHQKKTVFGLRSRDTDYFWTIWWVMQQHVDAIKTQMTGIAFLEPEPFHQCSPERCHVWRTGLVGGGKRF